MTTWTEISNALVAVGAKPFASTMQALRDNVRAAFEGDTTSVAAGVTLRLPALQRLTAGESIRFRDDPDATISGPGGASRTIKGFGLLQAGSIRMRVEHRRILSGSTSTIRVSRTRSQVVTTMQEFSTTSSSYVAVSYDAQVQPGDIWNFSHVVTGSTTFNDFSGSSRLFRISVGTEDFIWPVFGLEGQIEGQTL
jgi:hypothetical protein